MHCWGQRSPTGNEVNQRAIVQKCQRPPNDQYSLRAYGALVGQKELIPSYKFLDLHAQIFPVKGHSSAMFKSSAHNK